jgi:hypothetical protein
MAKKTTFQLDITAAGQAILQNMAMGVVQQSAQAILARADGIAQAQSAKAPGFTTTSRVGVIRRGSRAIVTITANATANAHLAYVARQALVKAKDAGRV